MKKIIVFTLLLTVSINSFSQQTKPSLNLTKQSYLKKSKKQRTAAWIMLGGGFTLAVTGFTVSVVNGLGDAFASSVTDDNSSSGSSIDAGSVVFTTGAVAMLGSIPFFITAHKNKKKAMSLSIKNETTPQLLKQGFVHRSVPSLTLKISL
jgi:hypothetical protein